MYTINIIYIFFKVGSTASVEPSVRLELNLDLKSRAEIKSRTLNQLSYPSTPII